MKSGKQLGFVATVSALFGAFACWLCIAIFGGEWKPVGDGRSVVNTRTGETRLSFGDQPTLEAVQGRWQRSYVEDTKTKHKGLVITPRSVTVISDEMLDKYDTDPSRVIESGSNWYVVELIGLTRDTTFNSNGGISSVRWRPLTRTVHVELVDAKTLRYDGETFEKYEGSGQDEWWKKRIDLTTLGARPVEAPHMTVDEFMEQHKK